jgi:hypothetical protein
MEGALAGCRQELRHIRAAPRPAIRAGADQSPLGEGRPIDIGWRLADLSGEDLTSDHAIFLSAYFIDIFETAGQLMFEIGKGLAKILGDRALRP